MHQTGNFNYPSHLYQQSFDYTSPSSSSMSTLNYATPSPSQYSFASSSPSASQLQAPSPDVRAQAMASIGSAAATSGTHPSMDNADMESSREYGHHYGKASDVDKKAFSSTHHPTSHHAAYNGGESMAHGHHHYGGIANESHELSKSSLKKYRHSKPQTAPTMMPSKAHGMYDPSELEKPRAQQVRSKRGSPLF